MTERPRWVDLIGVDVDYTEGLHVECFLAEGRGEAVCPECADLLREQRAS